MYRNQKLWKRVRVRVLRNGESLKRVAKTEGLSRPTVRKMLRHEKPVGYGYTFDDLVYILYKIQRT
jgi:transposase